MVLFLPSPRQADKLRSLNASALVLRLHAHVAGHGEHPFKMTPAKLRLAQASLGKPETKVAELCAELGITRQTLYRHMTPKEEISLDGEKLLGQRPGNTTTVRRRPLAGKVIVSRSAPLPHR